MDEPSYPRSQKLHKEDIQWLLDYQPDMQTERFWQAVKEIGDDFEGGFVSRISFRPDAYRIDRDLKVVEIHEVVMSHEPKVDLFHKVASLFLAFDGDEEWSLRMFVHRRGQTPTEVDLWYWYTDAVRSARGERREWESPMPNESLPADRLGTMA